MGDKRCMGSLPMAQTRELPPSCLQGEPEAGTGERVLEQTAPNRSRKVSRDLRVEGQGGESMPFPLCQVAAQQQAST